VDRTFGHMKTETTAELGASTAVENHPTQRLRYISKIISDLCLTIVLVSLFYSLVSCHRTTEEYRFKRIQKENIEK
jgi:hypothetical protein